jgi:hypothetical protein
MFFIVNFRERKTSQDSTLFLSNPYSELLRQAQELLPISPSAALAAKIMFRDPHSAIRIFCYVRRNIPPRRIEARNPPLPFNAASAPAPKARSIQ